jgi:nucleoside-diphosphate-sugar epimerase
VYGDRGGGWVDETAALQPTGERGRRRVAAEQGWLGLWRDRGVPVHIFRLASIYGPGRSPFEALRAGTAKRIDKPGRVFSRIHVEDLANVLIASIEKPHPGAVYNLCDDDPAPPEAVVAYAAGSPRHGPAAARASPTRPVSRRWRAASMTTTSGSRTT